MEGACGARDAQVRTYSEARDALFATRRQGCRVHRQDDPGRDDAEPGEGATHRDPRLREFRAESSAGARRPQSEIWREGARSGEIRAPLQGGQGTAREGRSEIGYWAGGVRA